MGLLIGLWITFISVVRPISNFSNSNNQDAFNTQNDLQNIQQIMHKTLNKKPKDSKYKVKAFKYKENMTFSI